ncbi:MAG: M23 family metallopeptidase [Marinicaulis sp.]|nr:M23 family metallopeptidase [Marinicaulis sp.]
MNLVVRTTCLSLSVIALAACGSHNQAPIVYGTSPTHTANIYNSPHDVYIAEQKRQRAQASKTTLAQDAQNRRFAKAYPAAQTGAIEPANLQKVSAVHLTETGEPARAAIAESRVTTATVARGDTVYAIGRRYGVEPKKIIRINNLKAPYTLAVGQKLRLPYGTTVATPAKANPYAYSGARSYTVRKGDTLYSISRASKSPISAIASANSLRQPYELSIGQQLILPRGAIAADSGQYTAEAPGLPTPIERRSEPENVAELTKTVSYTPPTSPRDFAWPVKGAVIGNFGLNDLGRRNDGVNIAAPAGTPVRAAANGEVVYRGSDLDGFGNLLLVKHNNGYVTAYAHNEAMLVKKGEMVRQGQVIAKVGQSGTVSSPQLHFEIRKNLKSVDPAKLLGPQ